MNEPWTLTWFSQVWVPLALGIATVSISIVSLKIARSAHAVSQRAQEHSERAHASELEARERAERSALILEMTNWAEARFPNDGELAAGTFTAQIAMLSRLRASGVPLATEVAAAAQELSETVAEYQVKHDDKDHVLASFAAAQVTAGQLTAQWSGGVVGSDIAKEFEKRVPVFLAPK